MLNGGTCKHSVYRQRNGLNALALQLFYLVLYIANRAKQPFVFHTSNIEQLVLAKTFEIVFMLRYQRFGSVARSTIRQYEHYMPT